MENGSIKFTILGEPVGKGRPKFMKATGHTYTPQKTSNYETLVQLEFERQCHGVFFPKETALGMRITAYKGIPKSSSKVKFKQMLENSIMPGKKPDWDNIGKIVCDALNGVAFADDSQIVDGRTIKRYADSPRVDVEIWAEGTNG